MKTTENILLALSWKFIVEIAYYRILSKMSGKSGKIVTIL